MGWAIKQVDPLLKKYKIEIPAQYACIDGRCVMQEADRSQQTIVVASEQLSKVLDGKKFRRVILWESSKKLPFIPSPNVSLLEKYTKDFSMRIAEKRGKKRHRSSFFFILRRCTILFYLIY